MDSGNENGQVKLADFDLDGWIDGTTGITGVARLLQKGDLLALRDKLETELRAVKAVPDEDRAVGDPTPESVQAQLDDVYRQLHASMLLLHIQDRTAERREKLRKQCKQQGVDDRDVGLHVLADAIVKVETAGGRVVPLPEAGFPPAKLVAVRDRMGDSALFDAYRVFGEVTASAPAVSAPLSQGSSLTPDGTTSRSRSARRGSGASRR